MNERNLHELKTTIIRDLSDLNKVRDFDLTTWMEIIEESNPYETDEEVKSKFKSAIDDIYIKMTLMVNQLSTKRNSLMAYMAAISRYRGMF